MLYRNLLHEHLIAIYQAIEKDNLKEARAIMNEFPKEVSKLDWISLNSKQPKADQLILFWDDALKTVSPGFFNGINWLIGTSNITWAEAKEKFSHWAYPAGPKT